MRADCCKTIAHQHQSSIARGGGGVSQGRGVGAGSMRIMFALERDGQAQAPYHRAVQMAAPLPVAVSGIVSPSDAMNAIFDISLRSVDGK